MNKPASAASFRRVAAALKREVAPALPVLGQQAARGVKAVKWGKVLSYACVLFGAGGALLPIVPDHWRVFIVALAGQVQSYLPPVQTYSQNLGSQQATAGSNSQQA